jgi:simple sugar transport system ATP-binding protein
MTTSSTPVLEGRGLVRTYGTVNALQGADFAVEAGTVTALIGDNGAGKSTLVKVLCGVEQPDGGEIFLDGEPVVFRTPMDAHRMGIETVFQDLALAPHLDAAGNAFLGRELRRFRVFNATRAMRRSTMKAFTDLGVTTVQDVSAPVMSLSGGQRQAVAVARSAMWAKRVIFLDEPTAALGVVQTRRVLDLIRQIRDRGLGVVLITHTLPDVLDVADRVEVLRFGRRTATFDIADATVELLVSAITGVYSNIAAEAPVDVTEIDVAGGGR